MCPRFYCQYIYLSSHLSSLTKASSLLSHYHRRQYHNHYHRRVVSVVDDQVLNLFPGTKRYCRSDIASYAPYAYDATIAAAMGVLSFAKSNNNGIVPHRINGLLLKLALIANVSFSGYSGKIEFSSGRPLISHYGVGDRTAGVRFIVYNFNPGGGSIYQYSLNRVGTWTTETGFQLCGSDPTLQSSVTGGCHDITYGTYGNARPEDRPSIVTPVMSLSIKATLFVLAAINFCLVMFFMAVLVKFRTTRLLKASQPSMTWIILTANLFSVCRIVLSAIDISCKRAEFYVLRNCNAQSSHACLSIPDSDIVAPMHSPSSHLNLSSLLFFPLIPFFSLSSPLLSCHGFTSSCSVCFGCLDRSLGLHVSGRHVRTWTFILQFTIY